MNRRKILLGSGDDCALRIRAHGVAPHHCALFVSSGALSIHHLASHGKTYVGDTPLKGTQRLQAGNFIRIGPITLEVQFDPADLARTIVTPVPTEEETERRPSEDRPPAAAPVVGVCKSKQWTSSVSPSDAAAGALKQLSHRE
jgi:pSer/pThr/pTyr-binding forkhead associated (FHA) protein